jgi:hypothetical protein
MAPGRPIALDHLIGAGCELVPNRGDGRGSGGHGLSLRCDDLDTVCEPYTEDDFRQLPASLEPVPLTLTIPAPVMAGRAIATAVTSAGPCPPGQ